MHWPLYLCERDLVPTVQEAGWAPGPVWTGVENLADIIQPTASCYPGPLLVAIYMSLHTSISVVTLSHFHFLLTYNLTPTRYKLICMKINKKDTQLHANINLLPCTVSIYKL